MSSKPEAEKNESMPSGTTLSVSKESCIDNLKLDSCYYICIGFRVTQSDLPAKDLSSISERLIAVCPPGSIIQINPPADNEVKSSVTAWAKDRNEHNTHPLLRALTEFRKEFLIDATCTEILVLLDRRSAPQSPSDTALNAYITDLRNKLAQILEDSDFSPEPLAIADLKNLNAARRSQPLNSTCETEISRGYPELRDRAFAGLLLNDRTGALASVNLLNRPEQNCFIIASTAGAGKSFLATELACDFISRSGQAVLIDEGGSYRHLCKYLNGNNIDLSYTSPIGLNPFSGIASENDLNTLMPLFLSFFASILVLDHTCCQAEIRLLETALRDGWLKHTTDMRLEHVFEYLKAMESTSPQAKTLTEKLWPYVRGEFSKWFSQSDEPGNELNALTAFDLYSCTREPQTQSTVIQLILTRTAKQMYLNSSKVPKLIAIDESWNLLRNVHSAQLIEAVLSILSKAQGVLGIVTQGLEDFEHSEALSLIFKRAAYKFILHQRPSSLDFAISKTDLVTRAEDLDLLRSLRNGIGFSEIFVKAEDCRGVYRFIPGRHTYYAYSTHPVQLKTLSAFTQDEDSLIHGIRELAEKDPLHIG